jgi:hypothetical protein
MNQFIIRSAMVLLAVVAMFLVYDARQSGVELEEVAV